MRCGSCERAGVAVGLTWHVTDTSSLIGWRKMYEV